MIKKLFPSIILILSFTVRADDTDVDRFCPYLPQETKFVWKYNQGPDFSVCYAYPESESNFSAKPSLLIGVYIGDHPDFSENRDNVIQHSKVGVSTVTWYKRSPNDFGYENAIETIYELPRRDKGNRINYAHIWILTKDGKEIKSALDNVIKYMNFDHIN